MDYKKGDWLTPQDLKQTCSEKKTSFSYRLKICQQQHKLYLHSKYLISKAGKRVGMLGRLRRSLTRESANVVYCSLIRPILEYCVSVWGCCGEGRKQDLEALQNRAARIVACTVRSKQALDVLKWPTLEECRRQSVFKLVKKCLQGQCPQYFKQYF